MELDITQTEMKNSEHVMILPWDTEFFNFPVAQFTVPRINDRIISEVLSFCDINSIRLLQYKCDCHDRNSVLLAEKNRFHFADIRMTFENRLEARKETDSEPNGEISFAIAQNDHIEKLMDIATDIHLLSRYYFDTNFPRDKVREFYRSWVRKAVLGTFDHLAYIICVDGEPAGFCTIRFRTADLATIGLVGIDHKQAKNGLGILLIEHVLNEVAKKGIALIEVVTQGRNYSAQRLYQKTGFMIKSTELIYHRWFDRTGGSR